MNSKSPPNDMLRDINDMMSQDNQSSNKNASITLSPHNVNNNRSFNAEDEDFDLVPEIKKK